MNETLYRLIFKKNEQGTYDVYEQHKGQCKGCFWTDEEFTGSYCTPNNMDNFILEYEANLIEGKVIEKKVIQ